jgi:hypothetical protein
MAHLEDIWSNEDVALQSTALAKHFDFRCMAQYLSRGASKNEYANGAWLRKYKEIVWMLYEHACQRGEAALAARLGLSNRAQPLAYGVVHAIYEHACAGSVAAHLHLHPSLLQTATHALLPAVLFLFDRTNCPTSQGRKQLVGVLAQQEVRRLLELLRTTQLTRPAHPGSWGGSERVATKMCACRRCCHRTHDSR